MKKNVVRMKNFIVNRQLAGGGDLTVELTDPLNEPVRLDMQTTADGDVVFEFIPTKIGQYKLSTKLAGFLVNGKNLNNITIKKFRQ